MSQDPDDVGCVHSYLPQVYDVNVNRQDSPAYIISKLIETRRVSFTGHFFSILASISGFFYLILAFCM